MAIQTAWIRNTDGSSPWTYSTNPNSVKITYPAATPLLDLLDTIQYVITGAMNPSTGGWTLVDTGFSVSTFSSMDGVSYQAYPVVTTGLATWGTAGVTAYPGVYGTNALLYYSIVFSSTTGYIASYYSDAARTQLVSQGTNPQTGSAATSVTLAAVNGSGISGYWPLQQNLQQGSQGTVQAINRVYKSLNADGVTYKYIVLNLSVAGYLLVNVVESYNTTTKVWSNQAYQLLSSSNAQTVYTQRIDIANGGTLAVFVTPRYFVIQSQTNAGLGAGTGNSWCGCVEVARDNVEDASAPTLFPCYGWMNGTLAITGSISNNSFAFSFPRDRFNLLGIAAANTSFVDWGFYSAGNIAGSIPTTLSSSLGWGTSIWNGKNIAFPITVGSWNTAGVDCRGRLFGLKLLTKNFGSFLDEITLRCDSQNFLNSQAGNNVIHCILTEGTLGARYAIPR